MKFCNGVIKSPFDVRDYKAKVKAPSKYPDEYDIFTKEWPIVKNQGNVGSCVAHSLATVVEFFNKKQENTKVVMSTDYIYGNRSYSKNNGSGLIVRDAIKTLGKMGDVDNDTYPGNSEAPECIQKFKRRDKNIDASAYPNRISSYYRLKTQDEIKENIMNIGPVLFTVSIKDGPHTDSNNILRFTSQREQGLHCMVCCGWNQNGWILHNSWGYWSEDGRVIYPYDYEIVEAWGVSDTVIGEDKNLDIVKPNNFSKIFYKIINKFLNIVFKLFKKK